MIKSVLFNFQNVEITEDSKTVNQEDAQSLCDRFKVVVVDNDNDKVRVSSGVNPPATNSKNLARDYQIEQAPDTGIIFNDMKEAILANNLDKVKSLHRTGFDLTKRNANGKTLIHFAASNNTLYDILKYLVDRSTFTFFAKDDNNQTPLYIACEAGNFKAAYLLALEGRGLNIKDTNGDTPLSIAIRKGHADIACMLTDNQKTTTDTKHNLGDNLLHLLARAHYTDSKTYGYLVELLIANKVSVSEQNTAGETPYQLACALDNQLFIDTYAKTIKLPSASAIKETAI